MLSICHGGPMDGAKVSRKLAKGRLKKGRFTCGIKQHFYTDCSHWRWCYDPTPVRFVWYEMDFNKRLIFVGMSERKFA